MENSARPSCFTETRKQVGNILAIMCISKACRQRANCPWGGEFRQETQADGTTTEYDAREVRKRLWGELFKF